MKIRFVSGIILSIIGLALLGQVSKAQSYTCVPETFVVADGSGGCCSLTVKYCYYVNGTTIDFYVEQITVPNGCNIVPSPGLISFLQKKILYRLAFATIIPEIPNCPATMILTVKAHSGNCMDLAPPVPGSNVKVYNLCGDIFCLRTCAICLSTTETDPCTSEPMVVFTGCSYSGQPCALPNNSQGCRYNTCISP